MFFFFFVFYRVYVDFDGKEMHYWENGEKCGIFYKDLRELGVLFPAITFFGNYDNDNGQTEQIFDVVFDKNKFLHDYDIDFDDIKNNNNEINNENEEKIVSIPNDIYQNCLK